MMYKNAYLQKMCCKSHPLMVILTAISVKLKYSMYQSQNLINNRNICFNNVFFMIGEVASP